MNPLERLVRAQRYFALVRCAEAARYLAHGVLPLALVVEAAELWSSAAAIDGGTPN